jgi:ABC-2 type transport system permease protein
MNRSLSISPAWWELIRITARQFVAFRMNLVFTALIFMIQLYVTRSIWEAVYAGRPEVDGVGANTLLVYLTIAALGGWFMPGMTAWTIQERVLSGDVALDLVRPFAFLKQVLAQDIGMAWGYAPTLVVFLPAALVVGSLDPPSPVNLMLYLVSFALGFLVSSLIGMHIGLLAFWIQQVNGIRAIVSVSVGFLSGALVPLWLMPDGVRVAFQFLPFQALAFLPASIYSGQVSGRDVFEPLAIQLLWIGLLLVTVRWVWKRAQDRIVIHGG